MVRNEGRQSRNAALPDGGERAKTIFTAIYASRISIVALAYESMAQTSAAPVKTSTRLITLGTAGGPSTRPERAQSSNLLTVNGIHYVVDAGDGVARRLAEAGVDLREIGTIFLTHHHDDDTAGLGTLLSIAWGRQRTKPINVYGPPRTAELVKAAVQYYAISAEIRIADGAAPYR